MTPLSVSIHDAVRYNAKETSLGAHCDRLGFTQAGEDFHFQWSLTGRFDLLFPPKVILAKAFQMLRVFFS